MQASMTPMIKQYISIKKKYQDCLVFFRMGDFYELFMEDAHIGSKVLDITLTGKSNGKNSRIPMAGVPYHAVDSYLNKLVKAGYKVAICEQVSEPNKYGIVDREVVRVVTPGTLLDEKALEQKENNYLISVCIEENTLGISITDISTGLFQVNELNSTSVLQTLADEVARIRPRECILPPELYNNHDILRTLKTQDGLNIFCFQEWEKFSYKAREYLQKHFGIKSLHSFGVEEMKVATKSAAALLAYLKFTQKDKVEQIKNITTYSTDEYMILDRSTILNLELFSTLRETEKKGSLIHLLDQTMTGMGGRMMRQWLQKPLLNKKRITIRQDAVSFFLQKQLLRNKLRDYLKEVMDIERILARLSAGIGNTYDLVSLRNSFFMLLKIKDSLQNCDVFLIKKIEENFTKIVVEVSQLIKKNIKDDPPKVDLKSGNLIKSGVNSQLDALRKKVTTDRDWIENLEITERKRTGISSLKVKFNKVFGFFIDISKPNLHLVPDNYIRKQTLVNGERFITEELKEKEEFILTAEEKMNDLEYQLFLEVVEKILKNIVQLQELAQAVASLDCLLSFAHLAEKENYCKPQIIDSGDIIIKAGRHPVVEKLLYETQFVPNDVKLNHNDHQLILITGPNMAGKSVYIRQVALIVLLAQIGSYVPAREAQLSIVDRVFVRSGASDVITSGLSTFMVEMVETAQILNNTTSKSLIIMDEIGRGTSTYDGISIAWAVAEYLVTHSKVTPKTLFATHYHELQTLEKEYPLSIKNYHMAIQEKNGEPIFLHTIMPGGASHSFGVAVAKLAGVPADVIRRATELLVELENKRTHQHVVSKKNPTKKNAQVSEIISEIQNIDINTLTPLQALFKIEELKKKSAEN